MSGVNPYTFLQGLGSLLAGNGSKIPVQQTQIINLPQSLKSINQNITLKGEVIASNPNGAIQIKTPHGDVTVKLAQPLPNGTKLDLQIPSGQPPREAFLQPSLTKALTAKPDNQTPRTPSPQSESVVQSKSPQPQNPDVKTLQTTTHQASKTVTQNGTAQQSLSLSSGQSIRLTPLPAQLQTMTAVTTQLQPVQTMPETFSTLSRLTVAAPNRGAEAPTLPPQTQIAQPRPTASGQQQQVPSQTLTPPSQGQAVRPDTTLPVTTNTPPQQTTPGRTDAVTMPPIRQNMIPQTMSFTVSGDRTPIPMITKLNLGMPQVVVKSITIPADGARATITSPLQGRIDSRVQTMTSPMYIRPPQQTSTAVSMSSTLGQIHQQQQATHSQSPLPLTLMNNSFAGDMIAVSTGYVTEDGNPVLQVLLPSSQTTMVSVNYPAKNLPAGTQVTLSPLPAAGGKTTAAQGATQAQFPDDALNQLVQALPQQQVQQLLDLIPSAAQSRQFPAAALLFLAAAKGGDLSAWLGNRVTRSIDGASAAPSKPDIQAMLNGILKGGGGKPASPNDPPAVQTGEWRGYQIPLFTGIDLQPATIWTKPDDSQSAADNNKSNGTRFIVDLHLTRMGNIQFDGLIHPERKTLDLSFVTQRNISAGMQDNLKSLWYNTLENMGYSGSIMFKDA